MANLDQLTTIHATRALRKFWPKPLASLWRKQYPNIFDDHDLRITRKGRQRELHFCEWFGAIYLFQKDGAYSLVEKYCYQKAAPAKYSTFLRVLGSERVDALDAICERLRVQPPDLFVYLSDASRCWFAEVKGPRDRLSDAQTRSHQQIARELKLPVEIIIVDIA
jgi:hypothetical protein